MRKFSSSRFYKLARTIVIAIIVLSIFGAYIGYQGEQNMKKEFSDNIDRCDKLYPNTPGNITTLNTCYNFMPEAALRGAKESNDFMKFSLSIAILLPIIFFGGGAIYKYIFPKAKNEK